MLAVTVGRPGGAEPTDMETEKVADERVRSSLSSIRLDWSGNRTGNSKNGAQIFMDKKRIFKSMLIIGALAMSVAENAAVVNADGSGPIKPGSACKASRVATQIRAITPKVCKMGAPHPPA